MKFGWIPDIPDNRDKYFHLMVTASVKEPDEVDLRSQCPPIEDQGNLGSCTSQALASMIEYLHVKQGDSFVDLSRLFIYYNERAIEHTINEDSGAMIRDGIKTLKKQGVCEEKLWPYEISKFTKKPTPTCYKNALNYQALRYYRINVIEDMIQSLAQGFPFVCGISVYDSFMSETVKKTGKVPIPKKTERLQGGHAILIVGYSKSKSLFIGRNSWGTGWGKKGYFTIPFNYLGNDNLSDDFWTVQLEG
jgi:C1A family cysteine protease